MPIEQVKPELTELQREWVTALRSGEYAQGYGKLAPAAGGYCCLGVLCEILVKKGVLTKSKEVNNPASYVGSDTTRGEYRSDSYLTKIAQDLVGLTTGDGEYRINDGPLFAGTSLTSANDSERFSFSQIADIIESKPEGLFKTSL